jgi:hypothetical protein
MSKIVRSFVEELLPVWRAFRDPPRLGQTTSGASQNVEASAAAKQGIEVAPRVPATDHRLRMSQII